MPHEESAPVLEQLEATLEFVGKLAGLQCKPSITEATQLLRDVGVASAASKLGKLSKGRNLLGHPVVGLEADIRTAFGGMQSVALGKRVKSEAL